MTLLWQQLHFPNKFTRSKYSISTTDVFQYFSCAHLISLLRWVLNINRSFFLFKSLKASLLRNLILYSLKEEESEKYMAHLLSTSSTLIMRNSRKLLSLFFTLECTTLTSWEEIDKNHFCKWWFWVREWRSFSEYFTEKKWKKKFKKNYLIQGVETRIFKFQD